MVVNGRVMKRPKRKATADLHDFQRFPEPYSSDVLFDGPFRTNIRAFVSSFARLLPVATALALPPPPGQQESTNLLVYRVSFRVAGASVGDEKPGSQRAAVDRALPPPLLVVHLDIVEEDVAMARSVYCDQCRVVGWSGHPVCAKRYHFIIRNECKHATRLHNVCLRCSSVTDPLDTRCSSCNYETSDGDLQDWAYRQLEDSTHLLHGVVHGNGYGHLLRVNGREGGSKILTGRDIMGFWDRLCKMLRVRKISVMDISKKYGLECRLLHAITTGRTWYGEWEYEFGAGSFALTAEAQQEAVDILSNLPIFKFFTHSRQPRNQLQDIIGFYWALSDRKLETVRDLFSFIVGLIHQVHEQTGLDALPNKNEQNSAAVLCAWSLADVIRAHDLMVNVLKAAGVGSWVTWRTLRGATCHSVGSLELLDYCLKGLAGRTTEDGMTVASRCNADTNAIEYRLEVVSDRPTYPVCNRPRNPHLPKPSEDHLIRDLKFLYQAVLDPETMLTYGPLSTRNLAQKSARKLLDCKQFVKDYEKVVESPLNPYALHIWCEVELVDQPKDYNAPPPELLVLPLKATVANLITAATKAFRDAYLVFLRFQADELLDYGRVSDRMHVKLLLGNSATVRVKGRCLGDHQGLELFLKERGMENWIVECLCGARDDDGERMVACDSCGVWRHTRCVGINDFEDVPKKFICCPCGGPTLDTVPLRKSCAQLTVATGPSRKSYAKRLRDAGTGGRCKNDMMLLPTSMIELERFGRLTSVGG